MQPGAVVAGDVLHGRVAGRRLGGPGPGINQLAIQRGRNDSATALSQHWPLRPTDRATCSPPRGRRTRQGCTGAAIGMEDHPGAGSRAATASATETRCAGDRPGRTRRRGGGDVDDGGRSVESGLSLLSVFVPPRTDDRQMILSLGRTQSSNEEEGDARKRLMCPLSVVAGSRSVA